MSNGNLKPHPSFHRLHPYAVFPCMIWPVWHTGHDKSCSFGFFSVDVLFVVFFFPGLADVVDFFFGSSGGGAAVILPELSLSTYKTISPTIFFSSSRKSAARYSLRSILRNLFSQIPVNSADFSNSLRIVPISYTPV